MAPDGSVYIDTKIDMSKLPAQLKQLSEKMKDGAEQAEKLVKASLAGIGVAIGALTAATANYLGTTDKIDKMSQSIGLSKKAYQEWDYILSQNGASIESLEMGMKTLVIQIDATNSAADKSSTALGQLGISATDSEGNIKSQEVVLREVISALQDMPQGTEKARLASELLGRSGTELAATLNQTSESTEALRQRAYDLGIVLGDDVVNAGVVLGDTLADIKLLGGGLLNSVITPLIPQIQEVANAFIEWALEGDRLKEIIAGAFDAIKEAWENGLIKALAAGLGTIGAITTAIAILNAVMAANPISLIIIGIGALVAGVIMIYENWNTVYTFLAETAEKLKLNFIILGSKMKEAFLVAVYSIKNGFVQLGLYIAQGFMQKIADLLTLLSKIPFIGKYFETASNGVNGFIDTMETAGEEAQAMTDTVIGEVKKEQDAVEDAAKKQIQALKDLAEQRKKTAEDMKKNGTIIAPSGSSPAVDVQPIPGLIPEAAEEGDDAGKALTSAMASAIDNTSIGVSDSIGAVMDNVGAAITTAIAVVKKIFAGIKAAAKFDPQAMYESFTEIITGLTAFFAKVGSLPSLVEAGKKVLDEFIRGMIENRETHKETFSNVVKYLLETARDELPLVVEFAFMIITDLATGIISNLPLLMEAVLKIGVTIREGIIDMIPDILVSALLILPALITEIIKQLPQTIKTLVTLTPEITKALLVGIIENLPELVMGIIEAMIYLFIGYRIDLAIALIEIFADIVKSIIYDIDSLFNGVAKSAIDGWLQGWKDGWNKMVQGIKDFCNGVIDLFKEILEINSPSKVFAGFGAMIMEGLKNGITGANIWDGIKSTFTTIIDNIKALFSAGTWAGIGDSIINGITSGVSSASSAISNIGAGISNVVSNIGAGISSVASTVGGWISGLFNADGTNNFRGGKAIINEEGAEMVTLPSGSKIMTANATAQMQDRAISQLLSGMKIPSFATAGSSGNKSITIENKINAPIMVDGSVFGRLVYETIDKAVV